MTKLLGPLPNGEWIACNWPELKHSKHLPSEYLQDSKRISRELTYYAEKQSRLGSKFVMLTFPALEQLSPVSEFKDAKKKSFEKAKLVRELLEDNHLVHATVIFERLEGEYRAKEQAIYWHFHVIVELGLGGDELTALQRLLNENSAHISNISAGVLPEAINPAKFSRAAFYCAKPCQIAHQIAKADEEGDFLAFLENSKNGRMIRRWGGFREFCRELSDKRLRVSSNRNENGKEELSLVAAVQSSKETRSKRDRNAPDDHVAGSVACQTVDDASSEETSPHDNFSQQKSENRKAKEQAFDGKSKTPNLSTPAVPEFCGTFGPTPGPGNKLYAHLRVRNFTEEAMLCRDGKAWWRCVREDQNELLEIWKANNDEAYDLKEFLTPFAHVLVELLEENYSNVQRPTITASPNILSALYEIVKVREPIKNKITSRLKLFLSSPFREFTGSVYEIEKALKSSANVLNGILGGGSIKKRVALIVPLSELLLFDATVKNNNFVNSSLNSIFLLGFWNLISKPINRFKKGVCVRLPRLNENCIWDNQRKYFKFIWGQVGQFG